MNKSDIHLNKPIYIRVTVLELSKTMMYDFHHDYMLPKYEDRCKICYIDTDSFIYEIKCNDLYADMKENIHHFDTSNYPEGYVYNMPNVNEKVLEKMKDEYRGKIVTDIAGLRSKMYSVRVEKQDMIKKTKGVKTHEVQKTLNFEEYMDCLRISVTRLRTQCAIRFRLHNVETIRQRKISLSSNDDKRCLKDDSTDIYAWKHYKLTKDIEMCDL